MSGIRRLVDYPWVLVRVRCEVCKRAGAYRLARLAVKYGAEILLDDLIVRLSSDCPWRDEPRGSCGARFSDLPPRRRRSGACSGSAARPPGLSGVSRDMRESCISSWIGSHLCIRMRAAAKRNWGGKSSSLSCQ
jgi:hypothetical protein